MEDSLPFCKKEIRVFIVTMVGLSLKVKGEYKIKKYLIKFFQNYGICIKVLWNLK